MAPFFSVLKIILLKRHTPISLLEALVLVILSWLEVAVSEAGRKQRNFRIYIAEYKKSSAFQETLLT